MSEFESLFKKIRITLTHSYTSEPIILKIGSTTIATLGNISASVGKAKSGKTFNVLTIVAALLANSRIMNYSPSLPSNKTNIIYIDTEQSRYHCQKTIKRIATLSGLSQEVLENHLFFLSLREYNPIERINIIDKTLKQINDVGLLVIDGLRDLLYDFNCPKESSCLLNKLMTWSSQYMLHIHTVLHINKSDENTRGHLGAELNNKSETILHIKKESNSCVVKPLVTRDQEFSPFSFFINDESIPTLDINNNTKKMVSKRGIKFDQISGDQHRQALDHAFGRETIKGFNEIIAALQKGYSNIGLKFGRNKIVDLNKYLKVNNLIVSDGKGFKINDNFTLS